MARETEDSESRNQAKQGWFGSRGSSTPSGAASTASSPSTAGNGTSVTQPSSERIETFTNMGAQSEPVALTPGTAAPPSREVPTVTEAIKTIKPEDFMKVAQTPCARNGFITGIVTGGLVGGVRFMMRSPIPKVANWAVGGVLVGATASFEWCQFQRRQEKTRLKRAVEVYQDNLAEKRREEYRAKAQAQDEEAERKKASVLSAAANKSWYKFW